LNTDSTRQRINHCLEHGEHRIRMLVNLFPHAAENVMHDWEAIVQVSPLLAGRTVVQLSTGTPREAREIAEWMKAHEIFYLDGAILCGPPDIGTEASQILLSGDEAAYERAGKLIECLGGTVRYPGTNVSAASALDLAWLCESYGRFLAVTHAACLCEAEGVGVDGLLKKAVDAGYGEEHVMAMVKILRSGSSS
jgi:3-hydroxyisobutyrate dehydrogenase-like beta-hydroxyacid dehydrogenase